MSKSSPFDAADYLDSPEAIADYLSEVFEAGNDKLIARALGTVAQRHRASGLTCPSRLIKFLDSVTLVG